MNCSQSVQVPLNEISAIHNSFDPIIQMISPTGNYSLDYGILNLGSKTHEASTRHDISTKCKGIFNSELDDSERCTCWITCKFTHRYFTFNNHEKLTRNTFHFSRPLTQPLLRLETSVLCSWVVLSSPWKQSRHLVDIILVHLATIKPMSNSLTDRQVANGGANNAFFE
jgi:hypothetical protein